MKEAANLKVQGNTNKMLIKQYWDLDPQAKVTTNMDKNTGEKGFVSQHIKQ